MLPIAVDAMGGDRAPGDILAGAHAAAALGIPVVLVGPEGLEGCGDLPLIHASEVIAMDDDAAQGRAPQEGLHAGARRRGRPRRQGQRDGVGRQHRRHDGLGAAAHGPREGRQPPGHRHADSGAGRAAQHPARRRRQRRGAGRVAGAVRHDGRHLRPPPLRHRAPDGRAALHRRGARQGRHPAQGGVRTAGQRPRHRLHRQRRGSRPDEEDGRRHRHRRLHRQRRAEDARGRAEGAVRRAAHRVRQRAGVQGARRCAAAGAAAAAHRR